MVIVTEEQRKQFPEWAAAKEVENAKEAANNAAMNAQQAAAKAAADKVAATYAAQAEAWKQQNWYNGGTTATVTTAAQNLAAVAAQTQNPAVVAPTKSVIQSVVQTAVDKVKDIMGVSNNSGGGSIVPPTKAVGVFTTEVSVVSAKLLGANVPTGTVNPNLVEVTSAIDKRKSEMAAFTGWDNDSSIRAKQQKAWDIYIQTGGWSSAEQIQLHADAEAMRKSLNIMYQGKLWGTPDKNAADLLILPDTQPVLGAATDSIFGGIKNAVTGVTGVTGGQVSSLLSFGALAIGGIFVFSLFRGRH